MVRLADYDMHLPPVISPNPLPFRTFILKIHQRCNLRCDYCYVYESGDHSWRSRPRVMSRSVIDALAFRIAEHAAVHHVPELDIVLHGGEPLLAGPEVIAYLVRAIRAALDQGSRASFSIQTNGVLLDQEFINLFEDLDLKVGLSLDGDMTMHDRHRRLADGSGSYRKAAAAAALLADRPQLFNGILSVVDLRNDPVLAYEALARFGPPMIDFLLPHGNWSVPPPGRAADDSTPYGDWLAAAFDHWYSPAEQPTRVRLFEEILSLLLGGASRIEEIGLSPVSVVVVESDGDIGLSDVFRSAADVTGLNVSGDAFDAALRLPRAAAVRARAASLAAPCRACPVGPVCGGGLYAHRHRAENGSDNPSVYCADLYRLITHVRARLTADLARVSDGGR
jgi:uncharacterized protein